MPQTSGKLAVWDKRIFAEWVSEATKRLVIPFLALSHTLLGIGLVLTVASGVDYVLSEVRGSRASRAARPDETGTR